MRKKLMLLVMLVLVAIFFIMKEREKIVFVKSNSETTVYTDEDITKVDNILLNSYKEEDGVSIDGIAKKYAVTTVEDVEYCKLENTTLISRENGFNIVLVEDKTKFSYYKEQNGDCELITEVDNVSFNEKTVAAYSNESVYTNLESLSDFEISGMVRVKKDDIVTFDSLSKRYTNPTAIPSGVLMIENNTSVVAFDKDDQEIYRQDNSNNSRNVLAINLVNKSLFMMVEVNDKYILEAYEISSESRIKKAEPNMTYDITEFAKGINVSVVEVSTKGSTNYGSFTIDSISLIVSSDFSKLFLLSNADTTLDIVNDIAYLKKEELYYVLDLKTNEREHIGNIKAVSFRSNGSSLYYTVLDSKDKDVYIRFDTR